MANGELKVVIVDDNNERKNLIKSYLPSYMDVFECAYGEEAIEAMSPKGGKKTDLVIMYADDSRGRSLYTFDQMVKTKREEKLFMIPVLLVTNDEFSDRAMEFLEIGNVYFYEFDEEIDENELYSAVMDAIDQGSICSEEDFEQFPPVYKEPPKSPDKIVGKSFSVPSNGQAQRSAVIQGEERIKELIKAVTSSKEKTAYVKQLLKKAAAENNINTEFETVRSTSAAKPVKPVENKTFDTAKEPVKWTKNAANDLFKINNMNVGQLLSNDEVRNGFQQNIVNNPVPQANVARPNNGPKRILVVDPDSRTEKACQLFLDEHYKIEYVDSGMKAIDYFIKNTADVVLMEYNLTSLNGERVLSSIRMQPNGMNVPVIMLFNKETMGETIIRVSKNPAIKGIIKKPIMKKQLIASISSCI